MLKRIVCGTGSLLPLPVALAVMAMIALATTRAEAFKLPNSHADKASDVVGAVSDLVDATAAGAGSARDPKESPTGDAVEFAADKAKDKTVDWASDKIEKVALKRGKKAWDWLEKTKKFGGAANKLRKRWGSAIRLGGRAVPVVSTVITTYDLVSKVGGDVVMPLVVEPAIKGHFRRKGEEEDEARKKFINSLRPKPKTNTMPGDDPPSPDWASGPC